MIHVARQRLQQCTSCGKFTLGPTCDGFPTRAAAPMKWSPDERHAHHRRQREGTGTEAWLDALPASVELEEE